ncbi:cyclophilin family peptidyl-prolyl cis-trans isomerase [Thermosporothrix hazakensis]|jgi:cyclophilin family peptidyl-prolyl cis-trans isomerase|uniref:peptidylprolyl isomerase n=2 Tax=Thermosporothrix TaxID=768650 RepID=A0A326U579_THEHA|nr:peptidylprolyl isomerase [Thermosporothrix hazakensis]PZW20807.1 cyclophilin family peptidyl-prolyl cis-trans isomerase [Thermosporothrix hazakensis]BBH89356.1 hypothetical protein KTC_41070 [Thermosporothrix sp. COM3]GCE47538.1 hypothetical protein KTH_24070 [Thermosporothrix hazakensis]
MPKSTKRTLSKRAARIQRALHTEPPAPKKEDIKAAQKRTPNQKPPARGLARYPWATTISLLIILVAVGTFLAYFNHWGPFAQPAPKKDETAANATATATADASILANAQATATVTVKNMPAEQQKAMTDSVCVKDDIVKQITNSSPAPSDEEFAKIKHSYDKAPAMTIDKNKTYCAGINTKRGLIVVELRPDWAPETVNNFVFLAQNKFYDGIKFHRVLTTGTMHIAQTGDPKGDGTGDPGYKIPAETVKSEYTAGTLAMAKKSGEKENSGSQFFINTSDNSKALQKEYNLFGRIVKGMDVALAIQGPNPDDENAPQPAPDLINHVVVVPASK